MTSPNELKERMRGVDALQDDILAERKVGIIEKLLLVCPWFDLTIDGIVQILGEDRIDSITTMFIHRHHCEHPKWSSRSRFQLAACDVNIKPAGITLELNGSHLYECEIRSTDGGLRWSMNFVLVLVNDGANR